MLVARHLRADDRDRRHQPREHGADPRDPIVNIDDNRLCDLKNVADRKRGRGAEHG